MRRGKFGTIEVHLPDYLGILAFAILFSAGLWLPYLRWLGTYSSIIRRLYEREYNSLQQLHIYSMLVVVIFGTVHGLLYRFDRSLSYTTGILSGVLMIFLVFTGIIIWIQPNSILERTKIWLVINTIHSHKLVSMIFLILLTIHTYVSLQQ